MLVVDVNVLIAAFLADDPRHERASDWLDEAFRTRAPVVIPHVVWSGFARILTNPRVAPADLTWADIMAFADAIASQPGYATGVVGLPGDVRAFFQVAAGVEARGNLVSDAYLAAVAQAYECPLASFDRDFTRFPGLRLVIPGDPT